MPTETFDFRAFVYVDLIHDKLVERIPMRLVVNLLAGLGQKTGIGHYTAELIRCMRCQCAEHRIEIYPTGWLRRAGRAYKRARPYLERQNQWSKKKENRGSTIQEHKHGSTSNLFPPSAIRHFQSSIFSLLRHWGRAWAENRFRAACAQNQYDLYHEPNFIPFPCDCPTVVTIHDLSVLLHPEWHPADRVMYFEKNFQKGLAQADHCLAISDFGRQEIIRTLGISPDRVTRTYMGIRRGLGPLPKERVIPILAELGLPRQYLLYLGTIEPRKNVLRMMQAYCALPNDLRSSWPLLLVGGWGWNTKAIADFFHSHAKHRGVVHWGYVKDRYLAAVYNGARALIYPSLYEGFGLPPLEMMACGGAVIASNAGALVETIGRKAHLVDPEDEAGWIKALTRVLQENEWWQNLKQDVSQVAEPYTWDRCAADTLAVYRQVVQGSMKSVPVRLAG